MMSVFAECAAVAASMIVTSSAAEPGYDTLISLRGESVDAAERIVAVYGSGTVAELGAADRDIYLLNATTDENVVVDFGGDSAQAEAFDTFGTSVGMIQLKHGVQRVKIPKCGYLRIGRVASR